jgi:acetyl esterase/lipase
MKALAICLCWLVCMGPASRAQQAQSNEVEPLHVSLWSSSDAASIDVYRPLAKSSMDTFVLIVPGGGFASLSPYDRLLAEFFRQQGYPSAVVNYRTLPAQYPAGLTDVMRAVRMARARSASWGIKASRIAVLGESAGGILAAIIATQPQLITDARDDLASSVSARPDLLLLLSPVISASAEKRYRGVDRWLGEMTPAQREGISPELHVNAETPPTILFHAADDPIVPYEGNLAFAQACWSSGVSAELHLFPKGGHGHEFYEAPAVSEAWRENALRWLRNHSSQPLP